MISEPCSEEGCKNTANRRVDITGLNRDSLNDVTREWKDVPVCEACIQEFGKRFVQMTSPFPFEVKPHPVYDEVIAFRPKAECVWSTRCHASVIGLMEITNTDKQKWINTPLCEAHVKEIREMTYPSKRNKVPRKHATYGWITNLVMRFTETQK